MKLKLETIKSAIEKLQTSNSSTVNELKRQIASLEDKIRKKKVWFFLNPYPTKFLKAEKSEELRTAQQELVTKTIILQKRNQNIQDQNRRKIEEQKMLQKKFLDDKEEILEKIKGVVVENWVHFNQDWA